MPALLAALLRLVAILLALGVPSLAQAQDTGLTLTLDQFGVGNEARRGDTAGIRLLVVDSSANNRNVIVRLERRDPDGDKIESQRAITTNPGVQQGVWIYVRVPYDFLSGGSDTQMDAVAYEARENENRSPGEPAFLAGRQLARLPISPRQSSVIPRSMGMLAMTGTERLGLHKYSSQLSPQAADPWAIGRGEATQVVTGIRIADMPDEWLGWSPFETLVWSGADPTELKGERARAIRDWVRRGGHLIIVLPPVGQTWTNRASNELYSILPAVSIQRHEGVDLEPYRPMLVGRKEETQLVSDGASRKPVEVARRLNLPSTAVVHTFTPTPDAGVGDAIRILNNPNGECVVVRRLVGTGSVTLIGINLEGISGVVDAQAFWHRILGKRGRILDEAQLRDPNAMSQAVILDAGIDNELNAGQQGASAKGLFLGFVLFVLYWLLAGPVGFAMLKRRGLTAHAWLGFFLAAVVFTALAWAGATAMRPNKTRAQHVTLMDHVYGQSTQRARTWASVLLPSYGSSTLRVGEPTPGQDATWNFISPWETSDDNPLRADFPDARPYIVDGKNPDAANVPTRATVKQIVADWAGDTVWRMPFPEPNTDGSPSTITWTQSNQEWKLSGVLKHELPGALSNLLFFVVEPQASFPPRDRLEFAFRGRCAAWVKDAWPAGEPIDLSLLDFNSVLLAKLDGLLPPPPRFDTTYGIRGVSQERNEKPSPLLMSAMFAPFLRGPDVDSNLSNATVPPSLRVATHGWDVASWFTHPCLVIIGTIENGPSPVPLFVDGKPVPMTGKTYVRWIYPLPDSPPTFQGRPEEEANKP